MKNKMNQLFKDKLFLVMMVLGLLTIVAAAGAVKIRKGDNINEQNPYLEVPQTQGILAENIPQNKTGNGGSTENAETKAQAAGSSDASYSSDDKSDSADKGENSAKAAGAGDGAAQAVTLNFGGQRTLQWPVKGNVVLDYSMETTVYFPTLDQYKCNPALIIQGDISDPVSAPADARVLESGSNEEIGNYVVLDLGNEYTAVCGQLKDIQVAENEYVTKGTLLGYVSEPTKYYSIEGNNVYFELTLWIIWSNRSAGRQKELRKLNNDNHKSAAAVYGRERKFNLA